MLVAGGPVSELLIVFFFFYYYLFVSVLAAVILNLHPLQARNTQKHYNN